jgi:1,4-alpha-glucan branching enzyme
MRRSQFFRLQRCRGRWLNAGIRIALLVVPAIMVEREVGEITVSGIQQHNDAFITEHDLYLFNEGTHYRLHDVLGAHLTEQGGQRGAHFAVWAPNARYVSVFGDFNGWDKETYPMKTVGQSGIWTTFVPGVEAGAGYKYHIRSQHHGFQVDKADPFAIHTETPPKTGSKIWDLEYEWGDQVWMSEQAEHNDSNAPISVYEVHIGSWMRYPDGNFMTYRDLAPKLAEYVSELGFTHVEFLPVTEHPFYGSWGYQTTGYFAPTSRFGTPQDFMYLVDILHQHGIGVILDWVPSHFPTDEHGLAYFDGTHLFEHADPRQGFHPDWQSYIFNFGRNEVRSFLLSSALHWLDAYHIDGIRVDAVASMLYLDYSREGDDWVPNEFGGRENLRAIDFLRRFNEVVYQNHPNAQTIAEESTSWPMVSRPTYVGGLGFGMKWDMGWMNDSLQYISKEPVYRRYHHTNLSFRMMYAFSENFMLPISHDEVVHGKGSLINKMPGDDWQRHANMRSFLGYMYSQPGKKLLFMGSEFGQWLEWNHDASLQWDLLQYESHTGLRRWVSELNRVYRSEPALYELDFDPAGFSWIDANDADNSVLSYVRMGKSTADIILAVFNFTPVPREGYQIGVPDGGYWRELLNSDAEAYWGSGQGNYGGVEADPEPWHGRPYSLRLHLPPLSMVLLKNEAVWG